ncbi:MAG: TlpA disulfide reductase family protein [Armatimonadota bacterium]|nr:TlpA disulfide reductase family protein [Armatimonadota bacterium]
MASRVTSGLAGFLLFVLAGTAVTSATDVQPAVGHRAPDVTLRDPEGTPVQLSRALREKAVFLNVWATWCPPCREEMASMERVYRDYKARGVGDPRGQPGRRQRDRRGAESQGVHG